MNEYRKNIMTKEALALKNAIQSLGSKIENKRIIVQVDNQAVVNAWNNQFCKNSD